MLGGIIDSDTDNTDGVKVENYVYKETIPLAEILKKNNAPRIIDYFSLDVEGAEFRVLKNFPFNEYVFLSMSIERPNERLKTILRKNHYWEVGSNKFDELYIHASLLATLGLKKRIRYIAKMLKTDWIRVRDRIKKLIGDR